MSFGAAFFSCCIMAIVASTSAHSWGGHAHVHSTHSSRGRIKCQILHLFAPERAPSTSLSPSLPPPPGCCPWGEPSARLTFLLLPRHPHHAVQLQPLQAPFLCTHKGSGQACGQAAVLRSATQVRDVVPHARGLTHALQPTRFVPLLSPQPPSQLRSSHTPLPQHAPRTWAACAQRTISSVSSFLFTMFRTRWLPLSTCERWRGGGGRGGSAGRMGT